MEVKDLLPDDNVAAGFDKSSAVLDISPVHLLRYQDAAEKAVRAVMPSGRGSRSRSAAPVGRSPRNCGSYQELLGKSARLDGDTLVLYLRNPDYIPCATAPVPADGRYRVRVCASAVGTGGKPLPMMCVCRATQYDREDTDVRAVRDVPAGKPAVIEEEFDLRERQVIVFAGWSLPNFREFEHRHKGRKLDADPGCRAWPCTGSRSKGRSAPGHRPVISAFSAACRSKPRSVARAEAEGRPVPPQPARPPGRLVDLRPARSGPCAAARGCRTADAVVPALAFRRPVGEKLSGIM